MKTLLTLCLCTLFVDAAEDPWAKVSNLKSGTQIRVVRVGQKAAVEAEFLELTDERLVLAIKKTQTSIPREEIDRIEARSAQKSYQREQSVTSQDPNQQLSRPTPRVPGSNPAPALQGSAGGVTFTKPGFELVYRKATR